MGVIKVIITILLVIVSLGGVLLLSYQFAQDNPFDTSHKHELVFVEAQDPTCDQAGNKAHYVCKGCDGVFADENGWINLSASDFTVEPLGHDLQNTPCKGIMKCDTCGHTQGTSNYHTPGTSVQENTVIGTCVAPGTYESVFYCKICGQEISREVVSTTLSGHTNTNGDNKCDVCGKDVCKDHTPVTDAAIPATCTQSGLTEGSHCSVCDTVLVAQQVVPAAHIVELYATGTLALNADGSFNTDNLVVSLGCTMCDDLAPETVYDYTINADTPFEKGGTIVAGDNKFEFPALGAAKYDVGSTYDGNDKTPVVVTEFTLKDTEFAFAVTSNHCIDLLGDGTVYSIYELDKLNNENVTVTYDAETGYLYSSKQNHTISYLVAYGANLTVTGDVHVLAEKRVNINTHLIVGTDSVAANLKVERVKEESSYNECIALWQDGNLTIKNGTLTTVGKATANWAVDINVGGINTTNPTANSVILIEKNGHFVTEGTGEYCVFINKNSSGRLIVDGTITSNRSIVVASDYKSGDQYEYGFEPALYIRHGIVNIVDTTMPFCVSSIQVGSEKENASGTLTIDTVVDCFRMARPNINYVFAKGTLDFKIGANDKTVFQMGGDGTEGATAYRPYYEGTEKYVKGNIDFKKDIVVNAEILSGSKDNYLVGVWRGQDTYVQNWMIEEGATFNLTNVAFLVRTPSGNNIKVAAYKELELNLDGTVKTVKVTSQLTSNITKANNYSSLVFATVDAAGTWTTDSATSAVNGWLKATDANGNVIYYK